MQEQFTGSQILVVDDDKEVSALTSTYLKNQGYRVCTAFNGVEALKAAEAESPDLILMNGDMPVMDGFEACRQLQDNPDTAAIPIVMVVSIADTDSVDRAFESGAEEFVSKPIHWASLRQRIWRTLERKAHEATIRHLAYHDALTGLSNRILLQDRLDYALARCNRHGGLGAVMFLDLDHFKTINDSLGHTVGDELLQLVAGRLKKNVRQDDAAARLGGDEFVVLIQDLGSDLGPASKNAWEVAEKIRLALSVPYQVQGNELFISPSIGVTLFPLEDQSGTDDILKQADAAMYRAKETGRNAVRFFQASMQVVADNRLELSNALRQALQLNEFFIHLQPQVDSDGEIRGAEALLRWQHPVRGLIPPDQFIPVAEEGSQILAIGEWVLHEACRWLKAWEGKSFKYIAVNVSPKQFRQADFVSQVQHALNVHGVDPSRLELELTEGMLLDGIEDAIGKMQALRELGIRFSIDDFGTGYSSLMYLKRLPLDKLKIDRSFVMDIASNPNDAAIVETIIAMARHLKLEVIAEGVETETERDFLQLHGCLLYQGYYFHRPMSVDDFGKLFESEKDD